MKKVVLDRILKASLDDDDFNQMSVIFTLIYFEIYINLIIYLKNI